MRTWVAKERVGILVYFEVVKFTARLIKERVLGLRPVKFNLTAHLAGPLEMLQVTTISFNEYRRLAP